MKLIFSSVEHQALAHIAKGPVEQAAVVNALIARHGANFVYMKIRSLAARGHITKELAGNKTVLTITPAGRRALALMDSAGDLTTNEGEGI